MRRCMLGRPTVAMTDRGRGGGPRCRRGGFRATQRAVGRHFTRGPEPKKNDEMKPKTYDDYVDSKGDSRSISVVICWGGPTSEDSLIRRDYTDRIRARGSAVLSRWNPRPNGPSDAISAVSRRKAMKRSHNCNDYVDFSGTSWTKSIGIDETDRRETWSHTTP